MNSTIKSRRDHLIQILNETYGINNNYHEKLARLIEQKYDTCDSDYDLHGEVANTIWVWYSGGDTAARAATKMMDYLDLE